MASNQSWQAIVTSSLSWREAHATLDDSVANLAPELRGKRPAGFPHSVWELLEHIRLTQLDLLEFMRNPAYEEQTWPDNYWPPSSEPPSDATWTACIEGIRRDTKALQEFTTEAGRDLTDRIPHGTGQTYLRTVLVAVDHTSYHVAQIIAVRRWLGAWPPS